MKYSPYILKPLKDLSVLSDKSKDREGAIIQYQGSFFDYHPWVEFGDKSVEDFLAEIREGGPTEVMLKFQALWNGKEEIPEKAFLNHQLNSHGKVVKLKYTSKDILDLCLKNNDLQKLRIDFNNTSSFEECKKLWTSLSDSERRKIEYMEDPFPKDHSWKELHSLGIPLACDRNLKDGNHYQFEIYKPNVDLAPSPQSIQIFSSYMGHDLGRYLCYLELMKYADLDLYHGIDTPMMFEDQIPLFKRSGDETIIDKDSLNSLISKLEGLKWIEL